MSNLFMNPFAPMQKKPADFTPLFWQGTSDYMPADILAHARQAPAPEPEPAYYRGPGPNQIPTPDPALGVDEGMDWWNRGGLGLPQPAAPRSPRLNIREPVNRRKMFGAGFRDVVRHPTKGSNPLALLALAFGGYAASRNPEGVANAIGQGFGGYMQGRQLRDQREAAEARDAWEMERQADRDAFEREKFDWQREYQGGQVDARNAATESAYLRAVIQAQSRDKEGLRQSWTQAANRQGDTHPVTLAIRDLYLALGGADAAGSGLAGVPGASGQPVGPGGSAASATVAGSPGGGSSAHVPVQDLTPPKDLARLAEALRPTVPQAIGAAHQEVNAGWWPNMDTPVVGAESPVEMLRRAMGTEPEPAGMPGAPGNPEQILTEPGMDPSMSTPATAYPPEPGSLFDQRAANAEAARARAETADATRDARVLDLLARADNAMASAEEKRALLDIKAEYMQAGTEQRRAMADYWLNMKPQEVASMLQYRAAMGAVAGFNAETGRMNAETSRFNAMKPPAAFATVEANIQGVKEHLEGTIPGAQLITGVSTHPVHGNSHKDGLSADLIIPGDNRAQLESMLEAIKGMPGVDPALTHFQPGPGEPDYKGYSSQNHIHIRFKARPAGSSSGPQGGLTPATPEAKEYAKLGFAPNLPPSIARKSYDYWVAQGNGPFEPVVKSADGGLTETVTGYKRALGNHPAAARFDADQQILASLAEAARSGMSWEQIRYPGVAGRGIGDTEQARIVAGSDDPASINAAMARYRDLFVEMGGASKTKEADDMGSILRDVPASTGEFRSFSEWMRDNKDDPLYRSLTPEQQKAVRVEALKAFQERTRNARAESKARISSARPTTAGSGSVSADSVRDTGLARTGRTDPRGLQR